MVFVDTSFLVAAAAPRDHHHERALELQGVLNHGQLLTTNHVLGEAWILALRRSTRERAMQIVRRVHRSPRFTVIRPDAEIEDRAWTWLFRHDEREYSFVDAVSFEVMRSQRVTDVLSFDTDFEAAGFRVLRA